jgi:hypothetical protein
MGTIDLKFIGILLRASVRLLAAFFCHYLRILLLYLLRHVAPQEA